MISKETFCKALRMIREQEETDRKFSNALNLVGDGHYKQAFEFYKTCLSDNDLDISSTN